MPTVGQVARLTITQPNAPWLARIGRELAEQAENSELKARFRRQRKALRRKVNK